jgi:hypothetical protein
MSKRYGLRLSRFQQSHRPAHCFFFLVSFRHTIRKTNAVVSWWLRLTEERSVEMQLEPFGDRLALGVEVICKTKACGGVFRFPADVFVKEKISIERHIFPYMDFWGGGFIVCILACATRECILAANFHCQDLFGLFQ